MKRFFIYIIGIGLLLTACDMESSDNGQLDGFWQMTSKTDQYAKCGAVDMRDSGITWAFQGKLLELRDVKKVHQDILGNFEHQGGTLSVSHFYLVDRDKGDILIDDAISYLVPYGVGQSQEKFKVVELTSSEMILESERFLLKFRKY